MWYKKSPNEIAELLDSNLALGLEDEEAEKRLEEHGENKLPKVKKDRWYNFILRQIKNPLVYILLIGVVITVFLRAWVDATFISLAILINVTVGFWQEFKSNNILQKLKEIVYVRALVTRGGNLHEINSINLVPGDIVHLRPGLKVPADARIIESHNIKVNQAALTGESMPAKKDPKALNKDLTVADILNTVYMGTVVESGHGKAMVVETGADTEIGKIALLTQKAKDERTPLQIRMAGIGKMIAIVVAVSAISIFIIGLVNPLLSLEEILLTAIAVSVAGVPEGLPAAISIILAVSAQKILKRKGVIRNLLAAETLGSATVICTDKTGTLTLGKMVVEKIFSKDESEARIAMALSNEAVVEIDEKGKRKVIGEPTDAAKLESYIDNVGSLQALQKERPQIGLLEFSPTNNFMSSLNKNPKGKPILYVTGAPEKIIDISKKDSGGDLKGKDKARLKKQYEKLAAEGFRVIAIGKKEIKDWEKDGEPSDKEIKKMTEGLDFLGLAAIRDPLREEVRASILTAKKAGIRTIMVTGDHKLTAVSIAKELSLADNLKVIEGGEMDNISDTELLRTVKNTHIFARSTPEHKIRIIKALREQGETVAMTGDGVNDAPALRGADIGISVNSGTDIAKEASDLVLLNNSFSTIVLAIKQGRIAFDNIRKVSVLLLTSSFSEIILIMSALLIPIFTKSFDLLPLPITALQIIYVNLVEDTLPNIAMAFEPGESDIMERPPIKKDENILDKESKLIIFVVGILIDIFVVAIFVWLFLQEMPIAQIQTIVFAIIGIDTLLYVFSIKSLKTPIWRHNIFNNKYLLAAVAIGFFAVWAGIYTDTMNYVLGTVPLGAVSLSLIFGLAILKMSLIEVVKAFFRKKVRPV